MIVSSKKHVGGYTPCSLDTKNKCPTPSHYVTEEHEFPSAVVFACVQRMQEAPFSEADVVAAARKATDNLLPENDAQNLVGKLLKKYKRKGKELVEYDNKTRSWVWVRHGMLAGM